MVVYYLDTSAILKRYRTEKGTDIVDHLYAGGQHLVTSHFSCLEVESVAARALKGRLLTAEAYDALLNRFALDLGDSLTVLPVSSVLVNEAIDAARDHAVRAPDAIHVASAKAARRNTPDGFVFVASDKELLAVVTASGIETFNPEAEDAMDVLKRQLG